MARLRINFDDRAFRQDLVVAKRRIVDAARDGLRAQQLATFEETQQEVPIDTGQLRQSGMAHQPVIQDRRRVTAQITYGDNNTRYALSVHENPRSGQTGGRSPRGRRYRTWARVGKWKYVEHPMLRAIDGYGRRMARFIVSRIFR